MPRVRLGCAGWSYEDWKGPFYPRLAEPNEYLARYARVFDIVECDSMHYGLPKPATTRRWAQDVPDGFEFLPKLPGEFTHEGKLRSPENYIREFEDAIKPLADAKKLGPTLAQFPPSFDRGENAAALQAFLDAWPQNLRLGVEFRHPSWWLPGTYDTLRRHGAALVWSLNDAAPTPRVATADWGYVRAIGDRALTRFDAIQRDRTAELKSLADDVKRRPEGTVYVLINNHYMGFGPGTAKQMGPLLGLPDIRLEGAKLAGGQKGLADF